MPRDPIGWAATKRIDRTAAPGGMSNWEQLIPISAPSKVGEPIQLGNQTMEGLLVRPLFVV